MVFILGCAERQPMPTSTLTPEQQAAEEARKAEEARAKKEGVGEKLLPPGKEKGLVAEEASPFKDIQFEFDRYDIRPDAKPVLDSIASWMSKNKKANILIEGHCDERGTNEYNLALGEKRAKATKDHLISLGVAPNRIATISYGEEKPACNGRNEDCWQRNRRAHTVIAK
ncbi:MAG: peptidoglycan-associated lipoprotein Pal [Nitrospirae bacterium]|nr:peptidoglycan-associated lipoprotein Pal [Nitrospirota bacterium]